MALRAKLELNWEGKEYALVVTMSVIDRIEEKINIGKLLAQRTKGDIRFSHVANLVSIILNESGAKTTQESVYEGMFMGSEITPENVIPLLDDIFAAFFPTPKKKDVKKKPTKTK